MKADIINNFDLRRPYRFNIKTLCEHKNIKKYKWLILIHYPNGKHHIFIVEETERQLLKRVKSICYEASDKIAYLDVYELYASDRLELYGEYTYRCKERK